MTDRDDMARLADEIRTACDEMHSATTEGMTALAYKLQCQASEMERIAESLRHRPHRSLLARIKRFLAPLFA